MLATFGLILVISLSGKRDVNATPVAVALYITAAYWCTSSTSFANPAVPVARSSTDSFSGFEIKVVAYLLMPAASFFRAHSKKLI